ncbi:MAG: hypothetical protein RLO52_29840 [Sandaracinaceae bacterium]
MSEENEQGRWLRETADQGETERALVVAAIEAASEKVRAERQGTETPPDAWADAVTRSAWALVSRIFPRGEQP